VNRSQAKRILLAYRPGTADADDPEVRQALALARQDAELRTWLHDLAPVHEAIKERLQALPVPPTLRDEILARTRIVRPTPWWRQPGWIAAAAGVVLLLGLARVQFAPKPDDTFPVFRSRMVSAVLRQYSMDIVTNDLVAIRRFHSQRGAPSDYRLSPGLARLPLFGAGVLPWQEGVTSMICLNTPDEGVLFLFVLPQDEFAQPPPAVPQVLKVSKLMTASWSASGNCYLLAGSGGETSFRSDAGLSNR
jgi:hypothetical protein